jgi:hypothetical protein
MGLFHTRWRFQTTSLDKKIYFNPLGQIFFVKALKHTRVPSILPLTAVGSQDVLVTYMKAKYVYLSVM